MLPYCVGYYGSDRLSLRFFDTIRYMSLERGPGQQPDIYAYLEQMEREQPPFDPLRVAKIKGAVQAQIPDMNDHAAEVTAKLIYGRKREEYKELSGLSYEEADDVMEFNESAAPLLHQTYPDEPPLEQWYEAEVRVIASLHALKDEQRHRLSRSRLRRR
jgi:hypothetical protein